MRTIYIFLFLLLGTIVSCGQGISIRDELHYGKGQMTCDYCLPITVYTDGYDSKYQKRSYLVTAIGDTLPTIDKSSLSFIICPENYGDLFLYVNRFRCIRNSLNGVEVTGVRKNKRCWILWKVIQWLFRGFFRYFKTPGLV